MLAQPAFHPSPASGDFDPAALPGQRTRIKTPLKLDCGGELANYQIAYQTYGQLNARKSNVIFICHALTGDQFVAEKHPVTGKPGWWEIMVGPGKVFDTNRFFIVCANVLGGCMGSEGPRSVNAGTGKVWGLDFPVITIFDMARAHKALLDELGIKKLFLATGGSMGGMQALALAALYPEATGACAAIATSARHSAQNIAFGEVGRQAIMADPLWHEGRYIDRRTTPAAGLSVARMAAHITYLSESALQRKFGRRLQDRSALSFGFDADFQVESYLRHQGSSFVARFDPNSYLYITRAMDYFDLPEGISKTFANSSTKFFVTSFTSDWLFPTEESRALVQGLAAAGAQVSFVEIESDKGHDAFLLDEPEFHRQMAGFIKGCEEEHRGVEAAAASSASLCLTPELQIIAALIPEASRVLDVGCGDGTLLGYLRERKHVEGAGLEIDRARVIDAIGRGLPVIQGDANKDLSIYPDDAFDVVLLNRTLSELKDPLAVVKELKRISRRVIVSIANFAHWRSRVCVALHGRAPVTPALPHEWYASPNIRFCTLDDFAGFARKAGMRVEASLPLDDQGRVLPKFLTRASNLLAASGLYVLGRN